MLSESVCREVYKFRAGRRFVGKSVPTARNLNESSGVTRIGVTEVADVTRIDYLETNNNIDYLETNNNIDMGDCIDLLLGGRRRTSKVRLQLKSGFMCTFST